jgi:hypothetical protein
VTGNVISETRGSKSAACAPSPFGALLVLLIATLLATGCRSPRHSFSERPAAVVINSKSSEEITDATVDVFTTSGFVQAKGERGELVFQKPGTFSNSLVHGDWSRGGVWMRVKMYRRELSPVQTVVDADIYMVQDYDDPLFQTERKVSSRRSEVQALLNKVAERLKH